MLCKWRWGKFLLCRVIRRCLSLGRGKFMIMIVETLQKFPLHFCFHSRQFIFPFLYSSTTQFPTASQFDRHLNPTNSISPFDIYHFPSHERSTDCRLLQNRLPSSPAVLLSRRLLGNPLLRHLGNLARCLRRNSRTSLWRPAI